MMIWHSNKSKEEQKNEIILKSLSSDASIFYKLNFGLYDEFIGNSHFSVV